MILVTGGAGFIGSNLVAALSGRGSEVAVADRLRDGSKWRNLAKHDVADIVAPDGLAAWLAEHRGEVEAVFHLGAISSTVETDVDLIVEVNFRLSVSLWNWCAEAGVPFIYASSAATYGDGREGFDDDASVSALARLRPLNAYGWSKHLFDRRIARLVAEDRPQPPQWAGLKFFNVYGPNEYHKGSQQSVVPQLHDQIIDSERCRLFESHHADYANGEQCRDFIWVGDCVDVMLWLADHADVGGMFNCGTGRARTFNDLAGAIFSGLGAEPAIDYVPTPDEIRDRYQYFTEARMDRLRGAGYDKPFTPLEDGVRNYVSGFLAAEDPFN